MVEVLRADPKARTRALRALVLGAAAGAAGITLVSVWLHHLERLASQSPHDAKLGAGALYEILIGAAVLAACAAAFVVLRRSALALQHGKFPPPGTRGLRDTPVLMGAAARSIATVGIVLGIALVACAAVLVVLLASLELCLGRFASG